MHVVLHVVQLLPIYSTGMRLPHCKAAACGTSWGMPRWLQPCDGPGGNPLREKLGFPPSLCPGQGRGSEVAEPAQLLQGSRRGRVSQALVPEGLIPATGLRVKAQRPQGRNHCLACTDFHIYRPLYITIQL